MQNTKAADDNVFELRETESPKPWQESAPEPVFEIARPETRAPGLGFGNGVNAKFSVGVTAVCPHCLEDIDSPPVERGASLFLSRPD